MLFILFVILNLVACNSKESQLQNFNDNTQLAKITEKISCRVTGEAHNGCCTNAGGPRECGSGAYFYSVYGNLQCVDGRLSTYCSYKSKDPSLSTMQ